MSAAITTHAPEKYFPVPLNTPKDLEGLKDHNTCPFCLEEFTLGSRVVAHDEHHPIHKKCAILYHRTQIEHGGHTTCPTCRKEINPSSLTHKVSHLSREELALIQEAMQTGETTVSEENPLKLLGSAFVNGFFGIFS